MLPVVPEVVLLLSQSLPVVVAPVVVLDVVPLVVPDVVLLLSQSLPVVVAPEVVLEVVPLVVPDVVLLFSQSLPVVVAPEVVPLVAPEVDLLMSLSPAVVAPDVVLAPLVVSDVVLTESASLPDVVLLVVPDVVPLVVRFFIFESLWSFLSLLFLLSSSSCISPLMVFAEVVLEVVPLVLPDVVLELWAKASFIAPKPKNVNAVIAAPMAIVLRLKKAVFSFLIVLMVIIIKVKKYKL